MTGFAEGRRDVPRKSSIPPGVVPLESILVTEELRRRPARPPEYERENRALLALAGALAESPRTILQTLADAILETTQSDSSGVSLLTADGKRFCWTALAGRWTPHVGGGTPRDFGPCGDVLDRNMPLLMRHWEWRYTYFSPISPPVEEGLLVPFYVEGKAIGAIWVVMHDQHRRFDAEDERLLIALGKFASSAYQALASVDELRFQIGEREKAARRVSEEALDKARADLAHMTRVMSLGALAASIAHEVNQPLSGIITNASTCLRMLAADPPNIDGARQTAHRTIRDGNRAAEVIRRLRALFVRKETAAESVDLNEAAREVIALCDSALQRNRVLLRSELAEDLPRVAGDRVQLQQVILNLLTNASDAMTNINDRPREIFIRTATDETDLVRLTVRDTGVGLDPRDADKLFVAFFTTKSSGMGIGLSVSRSIIESHRGRLWAASNEGPGATFSFSIPRASSARAARVASA